MAKKRDALDLVPEAKRPYTIPENWKWTRIEDINQYNAHSVDPSQNPDDIFELYSVPSSAEDSPEIVVGADIGSTKQSVEKNDILLCKINPRINRVWKVSQRTNHKLLASSEWIIIRNQRINPDYLMFWFTSPIFRKFMLSHVSGVGGSLMRAQPKYVNQYPVPLPPFPEQQRIVDRIESIFAKLDAAREKAQAVVDGCEQRRAAILHKAFTGELTAKWRIQNDTSLNSWECKNLGDCCKISSGGTPSRKISEYYEGNIPWVKTGEINWNEIHCTEESISETAVENSSAKLNAPGAVLVAMYGMGVTRGKAAILCIPATTNQAVCVLRPDDTLFNRFLFYFFMYSYLELRSLSVGGNQLNLSGKIISRYTITIPTIDEQREIVRILDSVLSNEQSAKSAAETVLENIDMMKKAILGRAFRGLLGTNNPTESGVETDEITGG